ncbi:MAG: class I SAM-dependent methyltransferase [Chitinophagaceae bacterium]
MNIQQSYNNWSSQYDTNLNKTRDLEAVSLRETLQDIPFNSCLEIGCGTGKNTVWLLQKAGHLLAVDLSEGMLALAKEKVQAPHVQFVQADITGDWNFAQQPFDLVTFSLVLEHIEDLGSVLAKASAVTQPGGYLYIGELHPFKQYSGSKARFETEAGTQVVDCYTHHLSDFTSAAQQNGYQLVFCKEYFDDNDRTTVPRIITLLFQKSC